MRTCRALVVAGALVIECATPETTEASVGRTGSLWEAVGSAATIVLAEVVEVERLPPKVPAGPGRAGLGRVRAVLKTKETWKGSSRELITFDQPYLWARDLLDSAKGKTVVAFFRRPDRLVLVFDDDGDEHSTIHLRLYPAADEIDALREAVREAATIQGPAPAEENNWGSFPEERYGAAYHRWLVSALARRGPRALQAHELFAPAAFQNFADAQLDEATRPSGFTAADRRRIAQGFVREPPLDADLPRLLALLRDYRDPSVDRTALACIEFLLDDDGEAPHGLEVAAALVLQRFGVKDHWQGLELTAEKPWVDKETLRARWARAAKTLPPVSSEDLSRLAHVRAGVRASDY